MHGELNKEEYKRYSRHIILPHVGVEGQKKLKNAKVLVVGAGGLGIPVLLYLAAAGVGQIGIVDYDHVEFSNLQRQVIYKSNDVGASKAELAKQYLSEQNPQINVEIFPTWIDASNVLSIIEGYQIIVDGTDNFPTRYLLNDAAVLQGITYVYGSIYQFEGQVSVFNYQDGPNYRDLFPEPPSPELVPNCSEGGVLGVLPGIVGSMQALETIKIITGIGKVLSGQLLTIDTLENQYRSFKFGKRKGRTEIKELVDYEQFCNPQNENIDIKSLTPSEYKVWMDKGKPHQLIDVREIYEYDISNIGGELIPKSKILHDFSKVKRNLPVVIHCRSGKRSSEVIKVLQSEHEFHNLVNLEGGLLRYAREIDPSLTIY